MSNYKFKSQQGFSLLWGVILLVVVLGGVTLLVARSGLNTSQASTYTQSTKASDIRMQGGFLGGGFNNMVTNGTAANTITFDTTDTTGLFNPTSGGTAQQTPDPNSFLSPLGAGEGFWIYKGANVKGNNIGTTAADYTTVISGLKSGVCQQLNSDLHGSITVPTSTGIAEATWVGAATSTSPTDTTAVDISAIAGVVNWDKGCMQTSDGKYVYFHVIMAQ